MCVLYVRKIKLVWKILLLLLCILPLRWRQLNTGSYYAIFKVLGGGEGGWLQSSGWRSTSVLFCRTVTGWWDIVSWTKNRTRHTEKAQKCTEVEKRYTVPGKSRSMSDSNEELRILGFGWFCVAGAMESSWVLCSVHVPWFLWPLTHSTNSVASARISCLIYG